MLIGVFGGFGSGKTLLTTIWGYKLAENPKYEVYSNYHIKHKNVKVIDPLTFMDINPKNKKAFVILDEVYAWLDSRVSGSKINRVLSWVILQSRKRNMDIAYTAQIGSSADLRLRDTTDLIVYCQPSQILPPLDFIYVVEWRCGLMPLHKVFVLKWEKAQKWFKKYDTREIVEPVDAEDLKMSLMPKLKKKDGKK